MTSEVRYEIKTSLPVIWLENIDKKSGLVRTQRTENDQLILVDPVEEDVEEIRPRTDPPNVWYVDLNKRKIITHLIESIITLLYIGLANIFNVITDYPLFVN